MSVISSIPYAWLVVNIIAGIISLTSTKLTQPGVFFLGSVVGSSVGSLVLLLILLGIQAVSKKGKE